MFLRNDLLFTRNRDQQVFAIIFFPVIAVYICRSDFYEVPDLSVVACSSNLKDISGNRAFVAYLHFAGFQCLL